MIEVICKYLVVSSRTILTDTTISGKGKSLRNFHATSQDSTVE